MKYLSIKDEEAYRILKTSLKNSSLIPIVGAGFTSGETTKNGVRVPDADQLKTIMVDSIVNGPSRLRDNIAALTARRFSQVAELYLKETIVPKQVVKENTKKYFLQVDLREEKKAFLSIAWPYIYTLNIDDAIEGNSSYVAVLPYLNIAKDSRELRCVYKVHGDARHEVIYDEQSSVIFSGSQYIRSLIKNESMLQFLRTDLTENNLLFVGCSLRDEIDLLYAIIGNDESPNAGSNRIYVTRSKPDALTEIDLETYNINTVLMVDDYSDFYRRMVVIAEDAFNERRNPLKEFEISNIYDLPKEKNTNLNYLLKVESTFDGHPHFYAFPYYYSHRHVSDEIMRSCIANPITIVRGRRFTGKSLLLLGISRNIKNKQVFYFSSNKTVTQDMLDLLFTQENSLFVFDSNVLNYETASHIKKNIHTLEGLTSSVLIACNSAEIDIANTFLMSLDGDSYYELPRKLDDKEYNNLNSKLSELGLINFKKTNSLLDNTYYLSEEYPDRKARIVTSNEFSEDEMIALIIAAVFDKIYTSIARIIGLGIDEFRTLAEKLHPLLEVEPTTYQERHHHSMAKLSVNSTPWLLRVVVDFYKASGIKKTTAVIKRIVKLFINNQSYSNIQQKIIMFDTLNQVFGSEEGGVAALIRSVYEEIQDVLSDHPDYWLQRSKSILKLENRRIDRVRDGIDYAKKAFKDGLRQKTVYNAEFTIALLYGKLCKMENYANHEDISEAVGWFYNAINKNKFNEQYINSMLEHSREQKGPFYYLCDYLNRKNTHAELLTKREEIQYLIAYSGVDHITDHLD